MQSTCDSDFRCGLACEASARNAKSLVMWVEQCEPLSSEETCSISPILVNPTSNSAAEECFRLTLRNCAGVYFVPGVFALFLGPGSQEGSPHPWVIKLHGRLGC